MEEAEAPRYWCHMCVQTVNPILEIDPLECPICQSGFVEEMAASSATRENDGPIDLEFGGSDSDRALSLWAPILLGMMGNQRRRRRIRRMGFEEGEYDNDGYESNRRHHDGEGEGELDRELEAIERRRRRRSSAAILQLLQGMRTGILSEPGNSETTTDQGTTASTDGDNDDRESVILINPFNQTIIVQGSYDPSSNESISRAPIGSLGDYFVGPGLDMLLQHLSENDPNRYGTPPAQKEAVEALPTVRIEESVQCSVCLDECEIGDEVKEMPCKHRFHSKCILPWLELHSSCPICRHQLPCNESSKLDSSEGSRNDDNGETNNGDGIDGERGRQFSVPLPWPFSSLFSSSSNANNPSTSSRRDEN